MSQTTKDQIFDHLAKWSQGVKQIGGKSIYLFGSLIYRGGVQFNQKSDIDLVVVMPELENFLDRHRFIESLYELKDQLETQLMKMLKRNAEEPIVSVVAATQQEITYDLHKDGHQSFFSENTFQNLCNNEISVGLPGIKPERPSRFVAACYSYAQKIRNEFLAISANGTLTLESYDGSEPLPKRLMRAAAMAARASGTTSEVGAEHDVQEGLELISVNLYNFRTRSAKIKELQDIVSVRRKARGTVRSITPSDHLLIAEMLIDIAIAQPDVKENNTEFGLVAEIPPHSAVNSNAVEAANQLEKSISEKKILNLPFSSTTEFFADRFARSFPGVRSIKWFDDLDQISDRLLSLLREPLLFVGGAPIWYWRGGNLHIEKFSRLDKSTFLMGVDELKISRIAAVHAASYHRHFVYVRTEPSPPTGLYPDCKEGREERIRKYGYESEEYGLYMNKHCITRSEYDDGSALIDNKLVETSGLASLRVRYLSSYNFLIAPKGSPINNPEFDFELEKILNQALRENEEEVIEKLRERIKKLPLLKFNFEE